MAEDVANEAIKAREEQEKARRTIEAKREQEEANALKNHLEQLAKEHAKRQDEDNRRNQENMKENTPKETPEQYEARRNQEEAARKAAELGNFVKFVKFCFYLYNEVSNLTPTLAGSDIV